MRPALRFATRRYSAYDYKYIRLLVDVLNELIRFINLELASVNFKPPLGRLKV